MKLTRFAIVALTIVYTVGLLLLSSIPGQEEGGGKIYFTLDKRIANMLHAPIFGGLFLVWFATLKRYRIRRKNCYIYALGISVLYGGFLEIYQSFIPGRYPSFGDILLNISGITVVLLFLMLKRK